MDSPISAVGKLSALSQKSIPPPGLAITHIAGDQFEPTYALPFNPRSDPPPTHCLIRPPLPLAATKALGKFSNDTIPMASPY